MNREVYFAFLDKVLFGDGCWEWVGSKKGRGYGGFWHRSVGNPYAHRFSYETFRGAIPSGMVVMHICDNRLCVNPSHLAMGTYQQNTIDMFSKGRGNPRPDLQSKTHCVRGHPLSGDNLRNGPWRRCKACNNGRRLTRRSSNRQAV